MMTGLAAGGAAVASAFPAPAISQDRKEWIMISTFPKGSPGLQMSGERLAQTISALSAGRLTIKTYGAGELAPALEVFDAVREGKAHCGNSMPYYWVAKDQVAAFFSACPGGLTSEEQSAWNHHGGGQQLWDEFYGQYNLKGFIAGSFPYQQLGWFRDEIHSLDDIRGLSIRITGHAGEVLNRMGATTTLMPVGEVFTALQSGVLDAAEFIGGWIDIAFGFHQVAKNFYGPGFHEPGSAEELIINLDAWNSLDDELKEVVRQACRAEEAYHFAELTYNDTMALRALVDEYGVNVGILPDDVLKTMFKLSEEVTAEIAETSPMARKVYESWNRFRVNRIQFGGNHAAGFLKWRAMAHES
jgi:TRAP-type mannitol/chloroaromatic compound transport system substrate-binding protein